MNPLAGMRLRRRLTGATLFSGGGLVECAFRGRVEWLFAVENEPKIAAHYRSQHGDHILCADVRDVDYHPWRGLIDWLHGSPVCTRMSVANAQRGETLLDYTCAIAFLRAVSEIQPRLVTVENVMQYRASSSFKTICESLTAMGYRLDFAVYQAADFGVPQTRKRMILRAWKLPGDLPPVLPTHAGNWQGWYAAIEDLIPFLPESELADWQKRRLGIQDRAMLVSDQRGNSPDGGRDGIGTRQSEEPAFTLRAKAFGWGGIHHRAILVHGKADNDRFCAPGDSEPSFCVTNGTNLPRAILVHGTSTLEVRESCEPSACVMGTVTKKAASPRAVLLGVNGENGTLCRGAGEPSQTVASSHSTGKVRAMLYEGKPFNFRGDIAAADAYSPSPVVTASASKHPQRATIGPRVVKMTSRCLARFQTVPDWYGLPDSAALAGTIIGNGVPCKLIDAVVSPCLDILERTKQWK